MPTLIIQDGGEARGGTFQWPLLIGTCPANAVMIGDNSVAHVHAWIGQSSDDYFIANATPAGRTFVNGVAIDSPRVLSSGDLIQVGGLTRMTYFSDDALPEDVRPVAFPWRAPSAGVPSERHSIECGCGATIIMEPLSKPANGTSRSMPARREAPVAGANEIEPEPRQLVRVNRPAAPVDVRGTGVPAARAPAGHRPKSKRQRRAAELLPGALRPRPNRAPAAVDVAVRPQPVLRRREPPTPRPLAPELPLPAGPTQPDGQIVMCGICQSRIDTSEPMTSCPECGLTFHADCWAENRGCAAYGCSQVGVLEPSDATSLKQLDPSEYADPFPWEFLLLGGSVISVVAGALAYGIPSAILAVLTCAAAARKGVGRWPILASAALCFIGLIVGVEFSKFWWLGIRPFQWAGL